MSIPDHLLAPVRSLVLGLPGAEEVGEGSVGDPVWKVRGRIFVMQHGHEGKPSLWMKAPAGLQEVLVNQAPDTWFRPPYVGSKGWIGVWLDDDTPWPMVLDQIEESWEMSASKTQIREWNAVRNESRS